MVDQEERNMAFFLESCRQVSNVFIGARRVLFPRQLVFWFRVTHVFGVIYTNSKDWNWILCGRLHFPRLKLGIFLLRLHLSYFARDVSWRMLLCIILKIIQYLGIVIGCTCKFGKFSILWFQTSSELYQEFLQLLFAFCFLWSYINYQFFIIIILLKFDDAT